MVAEARLAERLGVAGKDAGRRQTALLDALALPVRAGAVDADAVLSAISHDKKARDGRVPFVLAPSIGTFRVVYDVPPAEVRAALTSIVGGTP
jgi:3-dehydroquinate synthetase